MKRIIGILIVILAITIISIGSYLEMYQSSSKGDYQAETSSFSYQEMNISNQREVCSDHTDMDSYINTSDQRQIHFKYPSCVHEYDLSQWHKSLFSDDTKIAIEINRKMASINSEIEEKRMLLIKNGEEEKDFVISDIQKLQNQNDYEVQFIEANYQLDKKNYDFWYVVIALDENDLLTFEVTVIDGVLPYDVIASMFNSINVESLKEAVLNTSSTDDYQIGSLYQNLNNSYEHGYRIHLKIPNQYQEITTLSTDYFESVFERESGEQKVYFELSLEKDAEQSLKSKIETYHDNVLKNYQDPDVYKNITDSKIIEKEINSKKFSYFIYSYDYYTNGEKNASNDMAYGYYEIADGFFYKFYIANRERKIDEAFLEEILNFEVEKY